MIRSPSPPSPLPNPSPQLTILQPQKEIQRGAAHSPPSGRRSKKERHSIKPAAKPCMMPSLSMLGVGWRTTSNPPAHRAHRQHQAMLSAPSPDACDWDSPTSVHLALKLANKIKALLASSMQLSGMQLSTSRLFSAAHPLRLRALPPWSTQVPPRFGHCCSP